MQGMQRGHPWSTAKERESDHGLTRIHTSSRAHGNQHRQRLATMHMVQMKDNLVNAHSEREDLGAVRVGLTVRAHSGGGTGDALRRDRHHIVHHLVVRDATVRTAAGSSLPSGSWQRRVLTLLLARDCSAMQMRLSSR